MLLDSIRHLLGNAQSITYRFCDGAKVKILSESSEAFSLELSVPDPSEGISETQLFEVFFPFPEGEENSFGYQGRLLAGIESFVDELATGELVEIAL